MTTAQKTFAMSDNETLWQAATRLHDSLARHGLAHAIVGGVAVCLHGYRRNTIDIDLLVSPDDTVALRQLLRQSGWQWDSTEKQFVRESGAVLQLLLSGEKAGRGSDIYLPDPGDATVVTWLEGLPVLTLPRLIETKLACGIGNARRMHKDFADVVELIARNTLPRSFSRKLHKSLRPTFLELVHVQKGVRSLFWGWSRQPLSSWVVRGDAGSTQGQIPWPSPRSTRLHRTETRAVHSDGRLLVAVR